MRTSTAAAALALTAVASASPLRKRQSSCIVQTVMNPSTQQVIDSITQWNTDVNTVNSFLNAAPGLIVANSSDLLLSSTQRAFSNAQDEPCQLMTLASQPGIGVDAFTCAVQDLMNVFNDHVLVPLMTIIADPDNTDTVQSAVDEINAFRCCNVLPDVDILFLDSAANSGLVGQVPTSVSREQACANIQCTDVCTTMDNGSFGAVTKK